jgi:hypothetical protein
LVPTTDVEITSSYPIRHCRGTLVLCGVGCLSNEKVPLTGLRIRTASESGKGIRGGGGGVDVYEVGEGLTIVEVDFKNTRPNSDVANSVYQHPVTASFEHAHELAGLGDRIPATKSTLSPPLLNMPMNLPVLGTASLPQNPHGIVKYSRISLSGILV